MTDSKILDETSLRAPTKI